MAEKIAGEVPGGKRAVVGRGGAAGSVEVCNLGPYVTGDDAHHATRLALERAGFRWLDAELGAVVVTGLTVYYFGSRDALDVRTLLFYWQD